MHMIYNKEHVKVYLQTHLLMQAICKLIYSCRGSFSKRFSQTNFITQVTQLF
jgi:hypothetical protein